MDEIMGTCCQAPHSECGVLVHIRDGRVARITGDPDHPFTQGIEKIAVKVLQE